MLGVRGQPRLHGLTYGTDLIQRWGVEVGPAEVLDLVVEMEREREREIVWLEVIKLKVVN